MEPLWKEKKEVWSPVSVIGNKRKSLAELWNIFFMASTSSCAHSSLTRPEFPLSLEKFIFCSSSNKLSLNNVLEGNSLFLTVAYT